MNNSNSPIKAKNINTNASNPNNVNNKNMSRAGKNTGATDMSAGNNKKKGTEEGKTI
jgi:hypothetical protein